MENPGRNYSIRLVELGICRTESVSFKRCAVEPDNCVADGEYFYSHDNDIANLGRCDPNDFKIGRCLKENTCAYRATDCALDTNPSNFNAKDGSCTMQRDKSLTWNVDEPEFTQFGSCYRAANADTGTEEEYFCIFDPNECDIAAGEVYKTPAETTAAEVTCDCAAVHVYACAAGGTSPVVCGPKRNGCDRYTALTPHFQRMLRETKQNGLDCRLCLRTNTAEPTPSPTTKTKRPTPSPTQSPVKSGPPVTQSPTTLLETTSPTASPTTPVRNEAKDEDAGDSLIIGAIVGGSVAAVAFIAVAAFVFYRALHPNKNFKKKTSNGGGPLPGEISLGTLDDVPK